MVSKRLEDQFTTREFTDILPGDACTLTLGGPAGYLQIVAVYGLLPRHGNAARCGQWDAIRAVIIPPDQVWMAGDLNLLLHNEDQYGIEEGRMIGDRHTPDLVRDSFRYLLHETGLHEVSQDVHTYRSPAGTSNLDRSYTNLHVAWQQERELFCDPLPLDALLCRSTRNYHMPVHFGVVLRRRNPRSVVPVWATAHPRWHESVDLRYCELLAHEDGINPSAIRKLYLLKKAFAAAAGDIEIQGKEEKLEKVGAAHRLPILMAIANALTRGGGRGQVELLPSVHPRDAGGPVRSGHGGRIPPGHPRRGPAGCHGRGRQGAGREGGGRGRHESGGDTGPP